MGRKNGAQDACVKGKFRRAPYKFLGSPVKLGETVSSRTSAFYCKAIKNTVGLGLAYTNLRAILFSTVYLAKNGLSLSDAALDME